MNVAAAIYEQSVNVRKMSPVWWYATWWILARYVGIAAGLTACRNAAIGNLWYKFVPKGYIPLRDLYQICRGVGSPRSAQSRTISPLWLLKCGLRAPEIIKIGNLSYKFAKKGYTPSGGSTRPPSCCAAPPPVFLGTRPNYDALSAVLMDCNICVRPTSVYCLYYPLMSDHELIDLSYYVYLDIWRL